jgi:hydroxyacylglutathione hydrolase
MQICKGIDAISGVGREPNIYLVDGELLVDTGTGLNFSEIKVYIEGRYDYTKIKTIVNTHCHFDHAGGDKKFRDWLKASIAVHVNDAESVESGTGMLAEYFNEIPRVVTVDKKLREGSTLKTTNFAFEVIHTPGHTPGSICLYDSEKRILISGDTLFESGIGRTDMHGGDRARMLQSLNKLLNYDIHYLLPGHGPPKIGGVSFLIKQLIEYYEEKRFVNYSVY